MVTGKQDARHAAARKATETTAHRVMIAAVQPSIDGGMTPIKRVVGEQVLVQADFVADGHDVLAGRVLYRKQGEQAWRNATVSPLQNDRYSGAFEVDELGRWEFCVEAWVDEIASFQRVLERKLAGGEHADVISHLRQGATLYRQVAERLPEREQTVWLEASRLLDAAEQEPDAAREMARNPVLGQQAAQVPDPGHVTRTETVFPIEVEHPRAAFSSWYEFFPRSCGKPRQHGRLRDCEGMLRYVAAMGFDVVYLPPIHPIGRTHRKGRNNQTRTEAGDPGSPWAIGAAEGGHKAVHPELGTLEDLRWFMAQAKGLGLDVALDIAFQASPDHPYVKEHPEWFVRRPDGSIQYAENPPKKYQDIYPFHFECEDRQALWNELLSVFLFWAEQGVRIFRVDNPHTKSLSFWRFCVAELKRAHPDAVLLSEAFTRPKLMYMLAKLGFSQSYTYFTWRNTAHELREYLTELTQTELIEYFRPNLWPNTPDILPEHLQFGGRPAFVARLVLAATLGANYGIYGPAYELMASAARPGSGEYLDNEKYELKDWNLDDPSSLRSVITRVNQIRREQPALRDMRSLRFHPCDNETLLCYSKQTDNQAILVVVNLDYHHRQSGWVNLDLEALGVDAHDSYQVHDLLGGARFLWSGAHNYVELDPASSPAHIFSIRKKLRTEYDFDYFA